jgi:hypothetical protein
MTKWVLFHGQYVEADAITSYKAKSKNKSSWSKKVFYVLEEGVVCFLLHLRK